MYGVVPKSGFFINQRKLYEGKGVVDARQIQKDIKSRRESALWHFTKVGKTNTKNSGDEDAGRVMRSSIPDTDDWVVDMDAANCSVSDIRRLSRYALEYIVTLPSKTTLLLLVNVDDTNPFLDKALKVEETQRLGRTRISGRDYIRLKCALNDVHENDLLTGKSLVGGKYSEDRFMKDFTRGQCGFNVTFHNTRETTAFT